MFLEDYGKPLRGFLASERNQNRKFIRPSTDACTPESSLKERSWPQAPTPKQTKEQTRGNAEHMLLCQCCCSCPSPGSLRCGEKKRRREGFGGGPTNHNNHLNSCWPHSKPHPAAQSAVAPPWCTAVASQLTKEANLKAHYFLCRPSAGPVRGQTPWT